jgi:hypothetical protein
MTQRERAIYAAKWRKIALAFEEGGPLTRCACGCGQPRGLCSAACELEIDDAPVEWFQNGDPFYWPLTPEGDDCRVIAAGLIAAMYETGEFDA